ncbi:TetR/AcrR family transcriptional regulator [Streptomyces flavidovirens]|uniref:TetR/AcrR family transcriptional regulator n=1 Tax=Streptomyces flavidovirens TaxID=67298 RepID=A0ABW6RI64_9ACTN|nr:TetR/AcrR family transcriptional regulator [Streptomyces sp. ISL-99]MBT2525975.1 TetR/AcrR family transcriptional regulator [Streptomyces sp. ISL-99]
MARTRLTAEREGELYEAVLDLLREGGYDGLTMDAIASRTRSSKATLYRQWGSKPELVVRALRHNKPVSVGDIDTGTLRGDFRALVERTDDCQLERDSALMRGLAQAVHENPDLHQALRELLIAPELTGLDGMLRRAVDRGEIPAETAALRYVPHMLVGAFVAQELIEGRSPDRAFLSDYIDAVVLPALGAA